MGFGFRKHISNKITVKQIHVKGILVVMSFEDMKMRLKSVVN